MRTMPLAVALVALLTLGTSLASAGEETVHDGILVDIDEHNSGRYDLTVDTALAIQGQRVDWTFDDWSSTTAASWTRLTLENDTARPTLTATDTRADTATIEVQFIGLAEDLTRSEIVAEFATPSSPTSDGSQLDVQLASVPATANLTVRHGPNLDQMGWWLNVSDSAYAVAYDVSIGGAFSVEVAGDELAIGEAVIIEAGDIVLDPSDVELADVRLDGMQLLSLDYEQEPVPMQARVHHAAANRLEIAVAPSHPDVAAGYILDPVMSAWRAENAPSVGYAQVLSDKELDWHKGTPDRLQTVDGGALIIEYEVPVSALFALSELGGWESVQLTTHAANCGKSFCYREYSTDVSVYVLSHDEYKGLKSTQASLGGLLKKTVFARPSDSLLEDEFSLRAKDYHYPDHFVMNFQLDRLAALSASDPSANSAWIDGENARFYVAIYSDHVGQSDNLALYLHHEDPSSNIMGLQFVRGDLAPDSVTKTVQVLFPDGQPMRSESADSKTDEGTTVACQAIDLQSRPSRLTMEIDRRVKGEWVPYGVTVPLAEPGGGLWTSNAAEELETSWTVAGRDRVVQEVNFVSGEYRVRCDAAYSSTGVLIGANDTYEFQIGGLTGAGGLLDLQTSIGAMSTVLRVMAALLFMGAVGYLLFSAGWQWGGASVWLLGASTALAITADASQSVVLGSAAAIGITIALPMLLIPDQDLGAISGSFGAAKTLAVGLILGAVAWQGQWGIPVLFPVQPAVGHLVTIAAGVALVAAIVWFVFGRE